MSFLTPVAFLIFNRPDLTNIVFEAIREAKPQKLLVVADGPRFPEEAEKCEKARAVIQKIDWDCEVLTNFSETNMGCKRRVSSGLDWVFSEVEEAIILEDDCLPAPSFFNFCQTLLERYRYDERIVMIGGTNYQLNQSRTESSYYFSKYAHIWGWASWRRAWKHYDVDIKTWPEYKKQNAISSICEDSYEQKYWTSIFDDVFKGNVDTWDYQWVYTCWSQNGLSIIPNYNLISNVGFRPDATHVPCESPWANLPTSDIHEINHPLFVYRNKIADDYTFAHHYGGNSLKQKNNFLSRCKRKVSLVYNLLRN
ncbi:MAG: glycosyltransferase family 2 protein [Calothrix sp. C42_A2020_038]|nr:glycosyltransferase family 2 protein [Calothrix sp. C42_A2020_038]